MASAATTTGVPNISSAGSTSFFNALVDYKAALADDKEGGTNEGQPPKKKSLTDVPSRGDIWDPLPCPEWKGEELRPFSVKRAQRDVSNLMKNPPHGIFAVPAEGDISRIHLLIVGPMDTPYEDGFFHFLLRLPPDFPLHCPKARLLTTAGDSVRFNPNLYKDGKVCLSILGTWAGPSWAASLSIESVAISIQSLMNENPYHNEPGFEREERTRGASTKYNEMVSYFTLRVAVCEMMEEKLSDNESKFLPAPLKAAMRSVFAEYADVYIANCQKLIDSGLEGTAIVDPHRSNHGTFMLRDVMQRLEKLKRAYPQTDK